jgi:aspartyl/asparaginyl beta-hydroxylase (cupin superfamily)
MEKYFLDSDSWKYSETLKNSYNDLLCEFKHVPRIFYQNNKEYKINTQGNWKHITFIRKGKTNHYYLWFFPTVKKLLAKLPIYDNCMFSIIEPGTTIPPHEGHSDSHFRVHLGIKTDGQAWIRVGDQTQHWKEKEVLIFNDYANHEVCNPSDKIRVVFLFDIKREDYFNNVI